MSAKRRAGRCKVFVGASLDGFIARENGDIDWLVASSSDSGEEHGFPQFLASVDALVMGRATFDQVLSFPAWPYGDKPVFVLTHRPLALPKAFAGTAEAIAGEPTDVVRRLAERGFADLYVDGGRTIRQFISAGLVDDLIVTRLPILIGRGILLFGPVPADMHLTHVRTEVLGNGMVQSHYEVRREPAAKREAPLGSASGKAL